MEGLRVGPLVRAVDSDKVVIWTEWSTPGEVILSALPASKDQATETIEVSTRTVTVGGRHYALSVVKGLQPSTWYTYDLRLSAEQARFVIPPGETFLYCFRTLDLAERGSPLRLAYGSCHKLSSLKPDALNAFGFWLRGCQEEREALWPHILLLVGDQIYADDPPGSQASSFEDFAHHYTRAWTSDEGVRQALAVLPTSMIFDDHEITNNWNLAPTWQARALQEGLEQVLVDGLVAYWVYQGWGNIGLWDAEAHDLLAIMQRAAQNRVDALEALRARIRQAVYREKALQWDYTLPTRPPLFVTDLRADRSVVLDKKRRAEIVPRIMSQEQMGRLRAWTQEHEGSTLLLVASVPVLLPPAIGLAEYSMGLRPWQRATFAPARSLGQFLATCQQSISTRMGFEHWPVFNATWRELIELFAARQKDLFVLSGDVHFSYAIVARSAPFASKGRAALYQLVASPFRNELGVSERRLVLGQAWLRRAVYGGLHIRMLPLVREKSPESAPSDLLLQNVIALVTCRPQTGNEGAYEVQQIYMGVGGQSLEKVGSTPPLNQESGG